MIFIIALVFTFIIKLRFPKEESIATILIQLLLFKYYSLKMTKIGRNVTNKYGQVFSQVNCTRSTRGPRV